MATLQKASVPQIFTSSSDLSPDFCLHSCTHCVLGIDPEFLTDSLKLKGFKKIKLTPTNPSKPPHCTPPLGLPISPSTWVSELETQIWS
jgi:hypothetical protein